MEYGYRSIMIVVLHSNTFFISGLQENRRFKSVRNSGGNEAPENSNGTNKGIVYSISLVICVVTKLKVLIIHF